MGAVPEHGESGGKALRLAPGPWRRDVGLLWVDDDDGAVDGQALELRRGVVAAGGVDLVLLQARPDFEPHVQAGGELLAVEHGLELVDRLEDARVAVEGAADEVGVCALGGLGM